MLKKLSSLLLGLLLSGWLQAQKQPRLMLKTFPFRFIYGLNAELTFQSDNRHLVSVFYQDHQRDFFTVPGTSTDFNSIPQLLNAHNGYTAYLSYQFPVGNPDVVHFWIGPKFGHKEITSSTPTYNFEGIRRTVAIDQQNRYYLVQFTLHNYIQNFFIEAYFQAGMVNIQWEGTYYNPDGSIHYIEDQWSDYWLPHGLLGFGVGYAF